MKILILIAVRLHSTRLKRKALIKIGNKTILEHLVDRVKQAKFPDDLIICTSDHQGDKEIIELADNIGIKWFAGSEKDVLDRFIKAADTLNGDIAVRITGDNPLSDPEMMDDMLLYHMQHKLDFTYTEDLPRGTRSEIINVSAMKKAQRLAEDSSQSEYMSLYFRDNPDLFNVFKYSTTKEHLKRPEYRLTIDTPKDLEVIKVLYESLAKREKFPHLKTIIDFLDENPEIVSINKKIVPKWETIRVNSRMKKSKI